MIEILSQGLADEVMPEEMLTQTLERVRSHPWWKARARLATALLGQLDIRPPASVLDVGCGWGVTFDALEAAGYATIGIDISRKILDRLDRAGRRLVQADLRQPLPSLEGGGDALLLLDVIEHVDDDRQLLAHAAKLLRMGGVAIISVPALPELFSEFDRIQGHRRRYLPSDLRSAFLQTGLEVERVFWWGQWMVPILKRRGKDSNAAGDKAKTYADYLRLPPWPIPWFMKLAYKWEQSKALSDRLRTGTSLFAIARRTGDPAYTLHS